MLNIIGYYGVFVGMQYRNDVTMARVFDADAYDNTRTFTIRIPVSVPYMADDADFKRVDGKFEYQGNHYRLVKQMYAKDTLTVVCVRDFETEKIAEALTDYAKSFTDQPSESNQTTKITISFSKDFLSETIGLSNDAAGWETDHTNFGFCLVLFSSFTSSVVHPPERA